MKKMIAVVCFALPGAVMAQQKAPVAQYLMSVETAAGMSMPGMGAAGGFGGMMAGMMGGGQQAGARRLQLDLGSQRGADAPAAAHEIPAGMNMGPSLPLETPAGATSRRSDGPRESHEQPQERPKGRMLIFWGCGETTRAGQPVVIDFSRLAAGQMPPGWTSRRVGSSTPPGGRTLGYWPNTKDSKAVPDTASLRGEHAIRGNYTPDMRFSLGEDFMERIEFQQSARGGGMSVRWNAPGSATGYFATAMGGDGNDTVMWSSSEVQEMGGLLMDYVPPAEVARLIREKVVLSPQTTECTVPAEVIKRSGGSAMLNFIAYGPEANFAFPQRPQDPQWAVKVRFKSTAATLLGEGAEAASGSRRAGGRPAANESAEAGEQAPAPAQGGGVLREGVNILRGIFGR
jgi:hypothetical protein